MVRAVWFQQLPAYRPGTCPQAQGEQAGTEWAGGRQPEGSSRWARQPAGGWRALLASFCTPRPGYRASALPRLTENCCLLGSYAGGILLPGFALAIVRTTRILEPTARVKGRLQLQRSKPCILKVNV